MTMTAAELAHLRALAGGNFGASEPAESLALFCDRCGAVFATSQLSTECPHCAGGFA